MKPYIYLLILIASVSLSCSQSQKRDKITKGQMGTAVTDPYLWLEEIKGEASLKWVKERNARAQNQFEKGPSFRSNLQEIRRVVLATDRLPRISVMGGMIYDFWQDEKNPRGVWRRISPQSFSKSSVTTPNLKWEILLDLDVLAKKENENWVYKASDCLPPLFHKCLLSLSRGGKDATVVREFDLRSKSFVANGFVIPEAKNTVDWKDEDHLFVGTDFGPNTLTDSGYPRQVRILKRGQALASARVVFEGDRSDLSVGAFRTLNSIQPKDLFIKRAKFFEAEYFESLPDGTFKPLGLPKDIELYGISQDWLIFMYRSPVNFEGRRFAAGSLVARAFGNPSRVQSLFQPTKTSAISKVQVLKDRVIFVVSENVVSKIFTARPSSNPTESAVDKTADEPWKVSQIELSDKGTIKLFPSTELDSLTYLTFETFLKPPAIYDIKDTKLNEIRSSPSRFNASNMVTEQKWATSKDGTRVPYFLVRSKAMNADAKTVLFGYGGFEIGYSPNYLSTIGKVWLEKGNNYVVANIRGGGEFGPSWHQAAQGVNKQKSYDDFIAVAEDLIRTGVSSPKRLGILGGSNGGLLVGAVMVQRPELFGAVTSLVPLFDMLRYHELLAGPSWMSEYGDPRDPRVREVLLKYSPYQNVKRDVTYPPIFISTSTLDDRVHPGHARKMVARLEEYKQPVTYFENTEGGHSAAANLAQRAELWARVYTFFEESLR